jgi:hypothetical protein
MSMMKRWTCPSCGKSSHKKGIYPLNETLARLNLPSGVKICLPCYDTKIEASSKRSQ